MPLRIIVLCATLLTGATADGETPTDIYASRVIPLLKSETNRCAECHFKGINLNDLFTEDPTATFVNLRAKGWIDTDAPAQSKLLQFVNQHTDTESQIHKRVRQTEYEAIYAWVTAATANPTLLAEPAGTTDDLKLDEAIIRHTRADRLESRFVTTMWSQFERCAGCHSPERNSRKVDEHGKEMSWIVPNNPSATLRLLVDRGLINLNTPDNSSLRTKPVGLEDHGAGIKFPEVGVTDSSWIKFLRDYARSVSGEYMRASQLPTFAAQHRWRSGLRVRVTDVPPDWNNKLVNLYIYRIGPDGKARKRPMAFGESLISQERPQWSNSLEFLGKKLGAKQENDASDATQPIAIAKAMPTGKYRVNIGPAGGPPAFTTVVQGPWKEGHKNGIAISIFDMQRTPVP